MESFVSTHLAFSCGLCLDPVDPVSTSMTFTEYQGLLEHVTSHHRMPAAAFKMAFPRHGDRVPSYKCIVCKEAVIGNMLDHLSTAHAVAKVTKMEERSAEEGYESLIGDKTTTADMEDDLRLVLEEEPENDENDLDIDAENEEKDYGPDNNEKQDEGTEKAEESIENDNMDASTENENISGEELKLKIILEEKEKAPESINEITEKSTDKNKDDQKCGIDIGGDNLQCYIKDEPLDVDTIAFDEVLSSTIDHPSLLQTSNDLMSTSMNCSVVLKRIDCPSNEDSIGGNKSIQNKKPYECRFCDSGFSSASYRNKHERLHTGEGLSYCGHCNKPFADTRRMREHELTHTNQTFSHLHACNECNSKFKSPEALEGHQRKVHRGEKAEYKCKHCDKVFASSSYLKLHERLHKGGEGLRRCKVCNKAVLGSQKRFERHVKSHERFLNCELCDRSFYKEENRAIHIRAVHMGEKPFQCSKCDMTFKYRKQFRRHEKSHSAHVCSHCGKSFSTIGSLEIHVRIHTGEKPFSCLYCDKAFASSYQKRRHEWTRHTEEHHGEESFYSTEQKRLNETLNETEEKTYQCQHCGKEFKRAERLKAHVRTHSGTPTPSEERSFQCDHCDKTFPTKRRKYLHEMVHTGEKPHQCARCEKSFRTTGDLKVHVRSSHTGERPYKCSHCDKRFHSSQLKRSHEVVHSSERPFKCQHCEKAFRRPEQLKIHVRSHTGERPYKCRHCDKSFYSSNQKRLHEVVHSSERPFKCQHCEKAFRRPQQLKIHARSHTGERPYKCCHCDKSFTSSNHRNIHQNTHSKVHKCSNCNEKFRLRTELRSHMILVHPSDQLKKCDFCDMMFLSERKKLIHERIHTGEKPYKCRSCDKTFRLSCSRNDHERRIHADKKSIDDTKVFEAESEREKAHDEGDGNREN